MRGRIVCTVVIIMNGTCDMKDIRENLYIFISRIYFFFFLLTIIHYLLTGYCLRLEWDAN